MDVSDLKAKVAESLRRMNLPAGPLAGFPSPAPMGSAPSGFPAGVGASGLPAILAAQGLFGVFGMTRDNVPQGLRVNAEGRLVDAAGNVVKIEKAKSLLVTRVHSSRRLMD